MIPLTLPETACFLREHDNYIMLTHRRPDGDTIGCAAALCSGLRKLGKPAYVLENPQFTEKFRPYLEGLTIPAIPENAILVATDIATGKLMPYSAENYVNQVDLRIDHHGSDGAFGLQGYVDPTAAACGEIILDLLRLLEVPVDKPIAEALYCAISTDTGCFRYSNTTARTLRAAAECRDCGADTFAVNQVMFLTKRLERLKLELGLTEDDIDDISGFGREIGGVQIGVMLREVGSRGKISVRTSPAYDASAICALCGGGGHKAAAGATVDGGLNGAKTAVLQAISATGVSL